ncbi:pyridoxamine 5'-phosphate oxidase family protein, partial [Rhizobiaceae sp. 2RAB30]
MDASPFHDDERAAQMLAGVGAAGGGIRSFMPDQHRSFFELLPYLFVATTDAQGWPLATMLTGAPGFVHSPDPATLRVDALPDETDPAAGTIAEGAELGILGLDLSTRRRNRANGRVADVDDHGFTVTIRQSFGNCPQYIQGRVVHSGAGAGRSVEQLASLDVEA